MKGSKTPHKDTSKLNIPRGGEHAANAQPIDNSDRTASCPACNLDQASVLDGLVTNQPVHTCGQ